MVHVGSVLLRVPSLSPVLEAILQSCRLRQHQLMLHRLEVGC